MQPMLVYNAVVILTGKTSSCVAFVAMKAFCKNQRSCLGICNRARQNKMDGFAEMIHDDKMYHRRSASGTNNSNE